MGNDTTRVIFTIYDNEREKIGENIGSVIINLDELTDKDTHKRVEYIVRDDGLRTKSKLAVILKYVYSKVNDYNNLFGIKNNFFFFFLVEKL